MVTPLPEGIIHKKITVLGKGDEIFQGTIAIKEWSKSEARSRAFKKTSKIVGILMAISCIGIFIHLIWPFLITAWILTAMIVVPLFFRFLGERSTFFYVESTCPQCKKKGQLRPYANPRVMSEITLQCADCGETAKATF